MIDLTKEVVGLRRAYVNMRGADRARGITGPPAGLPIAVPGTLIPRTSWADVVIASAHILKFVDPNQKQCLEILNKNRGSIPTIPMIGKPSPAQACASDIRGISPRAFVRTADFKRAKENFVNAGPLVQSAVMSFQPWNPLAGISFLIDQVTKNVIYPKNEEFWGYATRLSQARVAAGAVPFWDEIVIESIDEAINEFPETLKGAAAAAFNAVDPRKLIPDVSGIAALLKWGSAAGALGLLYWYVLRPKKK